MPRARTEIAMVAVVSAAGCHVAPEPPALIPAAAGAGDAVEVYEKSIHDAAVATRTFELPLRLLTPDAGGKLTVVTWAKCKESDGPTVCRSYEAGKPVEVTWDVWVTGPTEVAEKCRAFTGDVTLRLQQLLGLPPATEERRFVTLTDVAPSDVIRPCTDPTITATSCNGTAFPKAMPASAPPGYYEWFARQAVFAWQLPNGLPWTRFGYTYDWAPGAQSPYGASEYVITGSLKPATVRVKAVQTTAELCRPTAAP